MGGHLNFTEWLDWLWNRQHPWQKTSAEMWLCPNIGSDSLRLFAEPGEWPTVRSAITAYQMYALNLLIDSDQHPHWQVSRVGPNTWQAISQSGLLDRLREWNIPLCLEVGSIKAGDCEGWGQVDLFIGYLQQLQERGVTLSYATMDEPLIQAKLCGLTHDQTVDVLSRHIRMARPLVKGIGMTEAYDQGSQNGAAIARVLHALAERDTKPDWLHLGPPARMDSTWGGDLRVLASTCAQLDITFGVVATFQGASTEQQYADGVRRYARRVRGYLGRNPPRWICQSWWVRGNFPDSDITQPKDLPYNLPETDPNSMTGIAAELMRES